MMKTNVFFFSFLCDINIKVYVDVSRMALILKAELYYLSPFLLADTEKEREMKESFSLG